MQKNIEKSSINIDEKIEPIQLICWIDSIIINVYCIVLYCIVLYCIARVDFEAILLCNLNLKNAVPILARNKNCSVCWIVSNAV